MATPHVVVEPPPARGHALRVSLNGRQIAVFNLGTALYALNAECTHVRGPLDQGRIEGSVVVCPWHGSEFDLASGAVRRGPAVRPVARYPVRIENQKLVIDLP
ncbi:MAG TPA: Rieske 2Fe-2S domain-containing protein [Thermoplasmata archaeon]|nr:Rieske 2Fe-2S domain-containing protein [Thermoplasmata archaeon]